MFPALDLCYTDPEQHIKTADQDLDDLTDLDRAVVRGVNSLDPSSKASLAFMY